MVTPKFDTRSAPSTKTTRTLPSPPPWISSYYVLLLVKLLLILIILFTLPKLVLAGRPSPHRRKQRQQKQRLHAIRSACQNTGACPLRFPIPEESLNCVNQCVSQTCFQAIYYNEPLEDGEVDVPRARAFEKCALEELLLQRRRRNKVAAVPN